MKTNKTKLFALLALGGLMAVGQIARADDTPAPATPPPAAGGGRGNMRAAMEKFLTDIKATDEQKEKLKPIFKERDDKLKALRGDTSIAQEDRAAKRKEITEATTAKVKGVLDADQFAKYEKFLKDQMGRGRRGQQPPPPADAPPKN
jgi:Spy/CpxP family protein refolding chaperone